MARLNEINIDRQDKRNSSLESENVGRAQTQDGEGIPSCLAHPLMALSLEDVRRAAAVPGTENLHSWKNGSSMIFQESIIAPEFVSHPNSQPLLTARQASIMVSKNRSGS